MRWGTLKERLEDKIFYSPCGCWLWTGQIKSKNAPYGVIEKNGAFLRAHRVSYELYKGPIPHGLVVMHACDNPMCVNPDHLSVGTPADNNLDMRRKGRAGRPGKYEGKLDEIDVRTIRTLINNNVHRDLIARMFDVCPETITKVGKGVNKNARRPVEWG